MNDSPDKTQSNGKACHLLHGFASLIECTAQDGLRGCLLIPAKPGECLSHFDQKLREMAPLDVPDASRSGGSHGRDIQGLPEMRAEAVELCPGCQDQLSGRAGQKPVLVFKDKHFGRMN